MNLSPPNRALHLTAALGLGILGILVSLSEAQVSSSQLQKSWAATRLNIGHNADREDLEHNKPAAILAEVLDTNILHRLAASVGLGKSGLATVALAQDKRGDAVLHQLYKTIDRPFEKLGPRLKKYVEYREDGHTKECLLTALTNPPAPLSISDLHLRIMAANEPALPVSWWRKEEDVIRNLGTKQEREVAFVHIDGDIAWLYIFRQTSDGKYDFLPAFGEKRDAKEFDPKYKETIRQVMEQVHAEMNAENVHQQFRSGQKFSKRVEERLKAKGIAWRSSYSFHQHRYE